MNQDILFIFCFLSLNFLCFLLGYLVNIRNQPNPFYYFVSNNVGKKSFLSKFYGRKTSDFLRINLEVSLLILFVKVVDLETHLASHLVAVVSLFGLIYITYTFTFSYFFRRLPMIKADLSFIFIGLTLAKNRKHLIFIGVFIVITIFYLLYYNLTKIILEFDVSISVYLIGIFCLIALGFKNIFSFPYLIYHERVVISPSIHFIKNLINSNKYFNLLNFEASEVSSKNIYSSLRLFGKPDIVIISVESLGSIAYKDAEVFSGIKEKLNDYDEKFTAQGIFVASSYSTPPQFAGGSWLSVGSLIYGYKMEHDTQYNVLFKYHSNFKGYKSILHYFKDQGYEASMIATLGGYEDFQVDWEKIRNVYPMDSFIKMEDIAYSGKLLDFMGQPSSPPDQYSLWKGMELIDSNNGKPKISLFTTLNSHCNWHSPLRLEKDYQELNSIVDFKTTDNTKKPRKENYTSSIAYQLEVVFDYVSKNPDKVYIIFGDHQPPFITSDSLGFETPLYVLSNNQKLIDGFVREGFHNGLTNLNHTIKHEGFYSLFMKSFLQVYSKSKGNLPVFPDGIKFEKKEQN